MADEDNVNENIIDLFMPDVSEPDDDVLDVDVLESEEAIIQKPLQMVGGTPISTDIITKADEELTGLKQSKRGFDSHNAVVTIWENFSNWREHWLKETGRENKASFGETNNLFSIKGTYPLTELPWDALSTEEKNSFVSFVRNKRMDFPTHDYIQYKIQCENEAGEEIKENIPSYSFGRKMQSFWLDERDRNFRFQKRDGTSLPLKKMCFTSPEIIVDEGKRSELDCILELGKYLKANNKEVIKEEAKRANEGIRYGVIYSVPTPCEALDASIELESRRTNPIVYVKENERESHLDVMPSRLDLFRINYRYSNEPKLIKDKDGNLVVMSDPVEIVRPHRIRRYDRMIKDYVEGITPMKSTMHPIYTISGNMFDVTSKWGKEVKHFKNVERLKPVTDSKITLNKKLNNLMQYKTSLQPIYTQLKNSDIIISNLKTDLQESIRSKNEIMVNTLIRNIDKKETEKNNLLSNLNQQQSMALSTLISIFPNRWKSFLNQDGNIDFVKLGEVNLQRERKQKLPTLPGSNWIYPQQERICMLSKKLQYDDSGKEMLINLDRDEVRETYISRLKTLGFDSVAYEYKIGTINTRERHGEMCATVEYMTHKQQKDMLNFYVTERNAQIFNKVKDGMGKKFSDITIKRNTETWDVDKVQAQKKSRDKRLHKKSKTKMPFTFIPYTEEELAEQKRTFTSMSQGTAIWTPPSLHEFISKRKTEVYIKSEDLETQYTKLLNQNKITPITVDLKRTKTDRLSGTHITDTLGLTPHKQLEMMRIESEF